MPLLRLLIEDQYASQSSPDRGDIEFRLPAIAEHESQPGGIAAGALEFQLEPAILQVNATHLEGCATIEVMLHLVGRNCGSRGTLIHLISDFVVGRVNGIGPDPLQDIFPACGGDGSAANVKILRYELIAGRLEPLRSSAPQALHQGQALKAVERLQANELQLQDNPCANKAGFLRPKPSHWPAGCCG